MFGNMHTIDEGLEKSKQDILSVQQQNQQFVIKGPSQRDYMEEQDQNQMRSHQLASKVVDLTHDTLPENNWKPIKKQYDKLPPPGILNDRVLLREWEAEQLAEYYKNVFDRRDLDIDVFKKF